MFSLSKSFTLIVSICAFTLAASLAFADNLGKPIELITHNGVPKLGVQYAYEPSAVMLAFTGTVQTKSLPGGGKPNFIATYDVKANKLTSDWQPLGIAQGNSINAFSFALDRKATIKTLKAFPSVVLVVTSDLTKIEANIDLGKLCSQHPGNFLDMTFGKQGCSPNTEVLSSLSEDVGGLCSLEIHNQYCSKTYDAFRDIIANQHQCKFNCN